mmetsp:Transcript_4123/g.3043  ORF Transcript_4123/g.3043 Transcript_4123/m.3043 type:complete len:84 (-) Transcript_4123:76-327(-)
MSLQMILEYVFGVKCDVAYCGSEALKKVEQRMNKLHQYACSDVYPLILTDINMPEMDGIQFSKKVRELISHNNEILFPSFQSH